MLIKDSIVRTYVSTHIDLNITSTQVSYCSYLWNTSRASLAPLRGVRTPRVRTRAFGPQ